MLVLDLRGVGAFVLLFVEGAVEGAVVFPLGVDVGVVPLVVFPLGVGAGVVPLAFETEGVILAVDTVLDV